MNANIFTDGTTYCDALLISQRKLLVHCWGEEWLHGNERSNIATHASIHLSFAFIRLSSINPTIHLFLHPSINPSIPPSIRPTVRPSKMNMISVFYFFISFERKLKTNYDCKTSKATFSKQSKAKQTKNKNKAKIKNKQCRRVLLNKKHFEKLFNYHFPPTVKTPEITGSWKSEGKSQLTGNDFSQFYRDFQGHEVGLGLGIRLGLGVGLGMELGIKSRNL